MISTYPRVCFLSNFYRCPFLEKARHWRLYRSLFSYSLRQIRDRIREIALLVFYYHHHFFFISFKIFHSLEKKNL